MAQKNKVQAKDLPDNLPGNIEVPGPKGVPKSKKVTIANSAKLDPKNPIPFEGGKFYSFASNNTYLPFLNPKNDFGKLLLEARLLSVTQAACIDTKRDFCAGNGLVDSEGKDIEQVILDWFGSMNLKNESIVELNKQIFESHFQFGNTPIEIVRFNNGQENRLYIYIHNFLEWRLGTPNEETDICDYAIQSKLFVRNTVVTEAQLKEAKKLPIYNPRNSEKENWFEDDKGAFRTLIWYKNSYSGYAYYGMPSSVSSLPQQVCEYKSVRYNLDGFDNNWTNSAVITLKGTVTAAENLNISKKLIETHTGDGHQGRVTVLSSETGMEAPDIQQLDTQKEGSFIELDNNCSQKIIFANKWDAVLAGMINASTLGKGAGFITKIFEIKQSTVIIPAQNHAVENVWLDIFDIAEAWLNIPTAQHKWKIDPIANINALSEVNVAPAVTVNEVRKANNLPELKDKVKGNLLMGEIAQQQQTAATENTPNDVSIK